MPITLFVWTYIQLRTQTKLEELNTILVRQPAACKRQATTSHRDTNDISQEIRANACVIKSTITSKYDCNGDSTCGGGSDIYGNEYSRRESPDNKRKDSGGLRSGNPEDTNSKIWKSQKSISKIELSGYGCGGAEIDESDKDCIDSEKRLSRRTCTGYTSKDSKVGAMQCENAQPGLGPGPGHDIQKELLELLADMQQVGMFRQDGWGT
jgi:hypothetical protein